MGVQKYPTDSAVFLREDDVSYYLLGAMMSDGHVNDTIRHRSFSIASCDEDWLKLIRDVISPTKPIRKTVRDNCYIVEFSSLSVLNWLKEKGCIPCKSLTLEFPNVPDVYLPDFVRGYLDGDGCVTLSKYTKNKSGKCYTYDKCTTYICSGSKKFVESLSVKLVELGFVGSFIECKMKKPLGTSPKLGVTWRLSFGDQTAIRFLNWTHYTGHKISLPRKQKIVELAKKLFNNKPGHGWKKKSFGSTLIGKRLDC